MWREGGTPNHVRQQQLKWIPKGKAIRPRLKGGTFSLRVFKAKGDCCLGQSAKKPAQKNAKPKPVPVPFCLWLCREERRPRLLRLRKGEQMEKMTSFDSLRFRQERGQRPCVPYGPCNLHRTFLLVQLRYSASRPSPFFSFLLAQWIWGDFCSGWVFRSETYLLSCSSCLDAAVNG